MSPAAKRKEAGEAVSDIGDQPAPVLKRRRTNGTCDAAAPEELPSRSSSNNSPQDAVKRTIEQEEQQTNPIGAIQSCQDVKVKDDPSASQSSSAAGPSQPLNPKIEERESFGVEGTVEEASEQPPSERHWRRSAAPSPFTTHHGTQRRLIQPEDIGSVLYDVRTPSASNPGRCPCGWYLFYAVCAHTCRTEPYKCGARRARSGATVFCASPAPRHNVDDYIVNEPCSHCLDAGPVVLPGS
ncbi:hypothetical protein V2A60_005036 [Cordyceps javanica]